MDIRYVPAEHDWPVRMFMDMIRSGDELSVAWDRDLAHIWNLTDWHWPRLIGYGNPQIHLSKQVGKSYIKHIYEYIHGHWVMIERFTHDDYECEDDDNE